MHWLLDGVILVVLGASAFSLHNLRVDARSSKEAFQNLPHFAGLSVSACFILLIWSVGSRFISPNETGPVYQVIFSVFFAVAGIGFLVSLGRGMFSKWETRLFCPHCGKFARHNDEWVCGYCDTLNNTTLYRECVKCENEPKAYRCHECQRVIFLGEEKEARHIAVKKGVPVAEETEEQRKRRRQWEKDQREHDLEITRLDAQLAQEKARLKLFAKEPESKTNPIEADFLATQDAFMTVEVVAKREMQAAEEKYRNDPEMLGRYREFIEHWKSRHM